MQYNMLLPMGLYAEQFAASGGNGDWKTMDEDLGNYYFRIYLQLRKDAAPQIVSEKLSKLYLEKRKADIDAKNNFFYSSVSPLTSFDRRGWQRQRTANSKNISHRSYSYFMHCLHQLCESFDSPFYAPVKRSKHA